MVRRDIKGRMRVTDVTHSVGELPEAKEFRRATRGDQLNLSNGRILHEVGTGSGAKKVVCRQGSRHITATPMQVYKFNKRFRSLPLSDGTRLQQVIKDGKPTIMKIHPNGKQVEPTARERGKFLVWLNKRRVRRE
ncbi:MAG: hypothetical protein ABIH20_00885 [Candidatus Diapherotrites archaeon]